MKSARYGLLFGATLILFTGCSSSRHMNRTFEPIPRYNREAMNHVIEGAIAELLGLPQTALIEYHQAAEIDSSSPGIFISLAENYYFVGQIQTSIRLAQKALRLDPQNLDALELLAAAFEKENRAQEAILAYQSILRINPSDVEIRYNLISLQLLTGHHERAYASYRSLIDSGFTEPEFRLQMGQLFLQARALACAENIFKELLQEHPELETPFLGLATLAMVREDTTQAIFWYRRALQQDPDYADAKAELRMLLEKQQNWSLGIEIFTDLVEKDYLDLDARLQLAQFHFLNGDTVKAGQEFDRAARLHSTSEKAIIAQAALTKIQQDTLAAVSIYRDALERHPHFLTVRRLLRDVYVADGLYDAAMELYEPLTTVDSTFVGSRIEIANLSLQKGDTLQAMQMMEKLVEIRGDDWRVPTTLARYYFIRGQNDQAAHYFDQSLKIRQDLPGVWVLRGINYMRMDSLNLALENFTDALKKHPHDPEMNYYAGFIFNQKRKYSKAIPHLRASLQTDPDNIQAMLTLASAYDELRQHGQAQELYEKILTIDSSTPVILNNYAYHLSVRGIRLEQALEYVTQALSEDPDNAAYLDTIGWVYFKLGNFERARYYTQKSLEINPSSEVYEHLGDIYFSENQLQKAREAWNKALKLDETNQRILLKIQELEQ
ncbi:tetratricopeptide repeat protein [candidate division KSB1 bacterium]|nr:tetratricopeptide repeat protein [candidate division KSB1 bacterium]